MTSRVVRPRRRPAWAIREAAAVPDSRRAAPAEVGLDGDDGWDQREETSQALGVAGWTLVSRITGLARVAVVGATLGPTFFANIFQATNTVPNLTYNLMAGSLLAAGSPCLRGCIGPAVFRIPRRKGVPVRFRPL